MLSSKSSARNCCSYWAPNSFVVKTGHTTVVIKLEGMLGARLVISPTVSLGLRPPRPNERQVLVRVLGAKVRDWAGGGGHLKFVDSLFHNCPSCLWNVTSSHLIWWKGSAGSLCIERAREREETSKLFAFFSLFVRLGRHPGAPCRGFASHLLLFDSYKGATKLWGYEIFIWQLNRAGGLRKSVCL